MSRRGPAPAASVSTRRPPAALRDAGLVERLTEAGAAEDGLLGRFARSLAAAIARAQETKEVTHMPKAVRYDGYDGYGGIDVLRVVEVGRPVPGPGQVLVGVKAAGVNPGEASIRKGDLHHLWPSTFLSGQGSDLVGVVEEVGGGVEGFAVGDEVLA